MENAGKVLWAVEELVRKRARSVHEAQVWLLVTKCSSQASCSPHPTPGRGAAEVEEDCPDRLGAEGRRAAK